MPKSRINIQEALERIAKGEYGKDIAQELGLSRWALYLHLIRNAPAWYKLAQLQGSISRSLVTYTREAINQELALCISHKLPVDHIIRRKRQILFNQRLERSNRLQAARAKLGKMG